MASKRRPASAIFLTAWFGLFTVFVVYGFSQPWRTPLASKEGGGIDGVISYLLLSTGVLVVVGHAVLCLFIWKSTGKDPASYHRPAHKTEVLWGIIPAVVMVLVSEVGVLALASPVWKQLYVDEPKDPLVVEVVGKQFEWFMRYPGKDGAFGRYDLSLIDTEESNVLGLDEDDDAALDDVVRRSVLYLPVGRPVVLKLRSQDVIHSFFVPNFRVKQDLIPGFGTQLRFTPSETGKFELACAELCGLGHYTMRGKVFVVEPREFEEWLAKQSTFGG